MAKSEVDVLFEIAKRLPSFAETYLISRAAERSLGTRIGYARDFEAFLLWTKKEVPVFKEKELRSIVPMDMGHITPVDIDRYLTIYKASHSESATARAKVSISAFYKYLVNTLEMDYKNPCIGAGKVSIPKRDYVIFLTPSEQETLLRSVKYGTGLTKGQLNFHKKLYKRDLAIINLFLDTGLRVSELVSLNIGDVDKNECSIIVTRKRKRISMIYFSDSALSFINDYLEERADASPFYNEIDDPLFITLKGNRITTREIEKIVSKYTKAALPEKNKISPHKLRSSFAMGFYGATKDILTLQEKMGHDSLNTTNIYAKAASSKSKETRNWNS